MKRKCAIFMYEKMSCFVEVFKSNEDKIVNGMSLMLLKTVLTLIPLNQKRLNNLIMKKILARRACTRTPNG